MKYLFASLVALFSVSLPSQAQIPELMVKQPPDWPTAQEYTARSAQAKPERNPDQQTSRRIPVEEPALSEEPGYTIQMGAFRDATTAQAMLESIALPGVAIQRSLRDGQPWYLVLMGAYPDKAQARAAEYQYLQSHPGADTWIRLLPVESD